ncbi:MAG TPA: hypothetical protein VN249_03150, partial [Prolixibacteraceae bacterium]|nr:hypothetical protein [Prolixibacteraceae bacterium]
QIREADYVLFSKTESLTESELTGLTEKFSAGFPGIKYFLPTRSGDLLQQETGDYLPNRDILFSGLLPAASGKMKNYQEYCLKIPECKLANLQELTELLTREQSIIRAKGYIYADNEWVLFNYTLSGISTEKCLPKVHTELVVIHEDHTENESQTWKDQLNKLFGQE